MFKWLAKRFIAWACRRERTYRKGHLYHANGSLYMGRWALFESRWLSARVHYIATADDDRALHDHPWNFVSLVLQGGYVEARPLTVEPCFMQVQRPVVLGDPEPEWVEQVMLTRRVAGAMAFRRATDRHRVVSVDRGTYTLFVYGLGVQWWGFYTREGKVHWQDFASKHAAIRPSNGGAS